MESFLSQLETRRGKTAADFSPPLSDLGVGEGGPAAKKPRLTLDEGMHNYNIARIVSELFNIDHTNLHKILLDSFILRLCEQC